MAFADAGASVVLAARREEPLRRAAAECERRGGQALPLVTDVRDELAVQRLADHAVLSFDRIDVWVNAAAVTLFARFDQSPHDLWREVLEVDVFGYAHGAWAAVRHFRHRGEGTLINVGSVNSRAGMPYVSSYIASKFAVRGLTESLRMELRGEGIDVCTVLPASVDTPLFQHAANYTGRAAKPLRPMMRPERVAAAIVRCARRPRREVIVGLMGRQMILQHDLLPPVFERLMPRYVEREHFREEPVRPTPGNVREPMADWTGASGGWKEGDASPRGAGPARAAMAAALMVAGLAARLIPGR
jgi:short-subunit dehydrogenase